MSTVPPPVAPAYGAIPNHLAWAIIATVVGLCLCCPSLITGIVAIVFASKVNGLLTRGDIDGARRASAQAKTWCWVTTALAIIGLFINIYLLSTGGMEQYMQMIEQVQQAS